MKRVAVRPVLPITENPVPRAVRQHHRPNIEPLPLDLVIPKHEEEGFIFDDRAANTPSELIPIDPRRLTWSPDTIDHLFIVLPCIRIEFGVAVGPKSGSMKLIGSRTRQDLNLPIAAPKLGVDWRKDHAELANHIRVDLSRGAHTIRVPPVLNAEAIP